MSWLLSHSLFFHFGGTGESLFLHFGGTGEAVGRVGRANAVYGMPVQSSRTQTLLDCQDPFLDRLMAGLSQCIHQVPLTPSRFNHQSDLGRVGFPT